MLVLADILEELKRLNATLERLATFVEDSFVLVPLTWGDEDEEQGEE